MEECNFFFETKFERRKGHSSLSCVPLGHGRKKVSFLMQKEVSSHLMCRFAIGEEIALLLPMLHSGFLCLMKFPCVGR